MAYPLHNLTIGVTDGANAPDEACTRRFRVRIERDTVALGLDESHASAPAEVVTS